MDVMGFYRLGSPVIQWSGGLPALHGDTLDLVADSATVQYVRSPQGTRQNFLVHQRPAGAGPLAVVLELSGDLPPELHGNNVVVFNDAEGKHRFRYADLRCWDALGTPLEAHFDLTHHGTRSRLAITVHDVRAVYPITIDPIATTPSTALVGTITNAEFGYPPSAAGDLNGDGYSDVVIGASKQSSPEFEEGAVYVYYGTATGIPTTASVVLQLNQISAQFGCSVSTAGDVNGDGYSDLIIGAQNWEDNAAQGQEGGAFIYFGSPTGIGTTPNQILQTNNPTDYFGANVATAGDINNDGYSDVIVGGFLAYYPTYQEGAVWIYLGSATGLNLVPIHRLEANIGAAHFGRSVAPAGDVNGDGYSDVIIGAPDAPNVNADAGKAWVYHGSASGLGAGFNPAPVTTLVGSTVANGSFGWCVSTAGDVNGDGYSDVVVGAYLDANGQANEGSVRVFHGSATGVSTTAATYMEGNTANAWMGRYVSTAGDINDDGYADLVVGIPLLANGQTQEGVARLHLGGPSGISTTVTIQWEANQPGANFGDGIACVGDVNGDGFSDVCIGGRTSGSLTGLANVYHGGPYGTATTFSMSRFGGAANAVLGSSVANAGDVNGDGYADALIGVPGLGSVHLHYGSNAGIAAAPSLVIAGAPGTGFGTSVASAGDVNGDGYADVVIGAPLNGSGAAFIHMGSPAGLSVVAAATLTGGLLFGTSVFGAGDVNTDGFADVIVGSPGSSSASVFHGTLLGINTSAAIVLSVPPASNLFGCSVGTAGDVNGDGFSDVIVGARGAANGQSSEGLAFVYLGSTTGLSATFHRQLEANVAGADFGVSVAGAGDVNGDGYSEVIVGADLWESAAAEADEGAAFIFNGSASGTSAAASAILQRNIAAGAMGASVAEAGDVNGDGYADVVVGAPLSEQTEANEGMAYVFRGSQTGASSATVDILQPNFSNYVFGTSVAGGGDLEGDGFSDVLVGAPGAAPSLALEGGAYWHRGNSARSLRRPSRQYDADLTTPLSTNSMDFSQPNFFGIGHRARNHLHRSKARLRWQVVYQGQPFTGVPITNSLGSTGIGAAWTTLPLTGVEIKELVLKAPGALRYKWRVRVEYDMAKLITGQRFSRWFYGYANSVGDIGILPIELIAFTGRSEGAVNLLEWTTASEQNSDRYIVERSTDGSNFSPVAVVPAAGQSTSLIRYEAVDTDPPMGRAYYRLVMIDLDGFAEISPVIAIDRGALGAVYPNPSDDILHVELRDGADVAELLLHDDLGRLVLRTSATTIGPGPMRTIDLTGRPPGHYTIVLLNRSGEQIDRASFIRR